MRLPLTGIGIMSLGMLDESVGSFSGGGNIMRSLAFVIVPLVLAGCSRGPAEEAPAEEPAAVEVEAIGMVTANGSQPGTYEVTNADGTIGTSVLNADGTYTDTAADGTLQAEGTWAVTDGKTCFSPTTEGVEAMCFTETAPADDGSFTATPEEGEAVTVRPVVAE